MPCIFVKDSNIYFAGTWLYRYIVIELSCDSVWNIYNYPINPQDFRSPIILEETDGIIFSGYTKTCKKFIYTSKQWTTVYNDTIDKYFYSQESNTNTLSISTTLGTKEYQFPLPSYNAYFRYRHISPKPYYALNANIGQRIVRNNCIWFLIDFYDAEGFTGVGGIGIFDLKSNRFGVIRDPSLASCSAGRLLLYGNTLIIATNHNGEHGISEDNGLVLIDSKKGLLAHIPKLERSVADCYMAMKIHNNILWITIDRGIISWNLAKNVYSIYCIKYLVVNKPTLIYRLPAFPRYNQRDSSTAENNLYMVSHCNVGDTLIYKSQYGNDNTIEVISKASINGWMSEINYNYMCELIDEEVRFYAVFETIYLDSSLKTPYHSYYISGEKCIDPIKRQNGTIYVTTHNAFVKESDIEPIITPICERKSIQLKWRSILQDAKNLKQLAFSTLNKEQKEISLKIPVFDDTIKIYDKRNLCKMDVIDIRWSPSRHCKSRQIAQGIEFGFNASFGQNQMVYSIMEKECQSVIQFV